MCSVEEPIKWCYQQPRLWKQTPQGQIVKQVTSSGVLVRFKTRSVLYCRESPQFIWDINHTTSFKIIVVITAIACPVTIVLNLLVITAVKTRRELKKNSNILLSGVALSDLLVGAVSMPLTITLDASAIQRILIVDIVCTVQFISACVIYTICGASILLLLLIAWEWYVAAEKCSISLLLQAATQKCTRQLRGWRQY